MRNPGGYLLVVEPGQSDVERDTFTCGHCNSVVIVKPKQDATSLGGLCKQCYKLICTACTNEGRCTPFEMKLEQEEARFRSLRSMGLA